MCLEFADKILIFAVLKRRVYNGEKQRPVFVFIIFAVLLGEIGKEYNVAYNSTFAYSVYGTFDTNRYCSMAYFPFFKMAAVRHLGFLKVGNFKFSTSGPVRRLSVRHCAKFGEDRSKRSGDMADFPFSRWRPSAILDL